MTILEIKAEIFDIIDTQTKYQNVLQQLEQMKQKKYVELQEVLQKEQQEQEAVKNDTLDS